MDSGCVLSYTPVMVLRVILAVLVCLGAALAQNTNTIAVTASRTSNAQADQVVFRVSVDAPIETTRDEALNILQGSGITAANFQTVGTVQQYDQMGQTATTLIEWTFALPVAISDMKATIGLLSAVQTSNAKQKNGTSITFGVQGTQYSNQALQAQQCTAADLLADARAQAQKLAAAAGKSVGAVLSISGAVQATPPSSLFTSTTYVQSCTMVVRFQLSTAGF